MGLIRGRDKNHSSDDHHMSVPSVKNKDVAVERSQISARSQTESIRSQIKRVGPICPPTKKSAPPQYSSTQEDVQFDNQLGKLDKQRFSSSSPAAADIHHDSMWLSSDCTSPSSFFQEHESSIPCFHLLTLADPYVSGNNRKDEMTDKSVFVCLEQACEEENMEDLGGDDEHEPLFWPFDRKIDWDSEEAWNNYFMSPRKDMMGSTASKILGLNKGPSRLRESNQVSVKIVPVDIDNQILPLEAGELFFNTKSDLRSRNFWEDDYALDGEELPIETVLGLEEFDGHEGIDSEFNEGVFLLDEAL